MIIRLLDRVKDDAPVPDGGSDADVITVESVDVGGRPSREDGLDGQPSAAEPAQLELSCQTGSNGYQVVSVAGELDIATAEQAYSYISEVIDGRFRGTAPVTVDLSGLTFCDASGLGALARLARHARETGRQLMLTSVRPPLMKIIRITGLDRAFPELHPSAHAYSALPRSVPGRPDRGAPQPDRGAPPA